VVSLGALLHDVGKSRIDPAIVNCKGKLSPKQFEAGRVALRRGRTLTPPV